MKAQPWPFISVSSVAAFMLVWVAGLSGGNRDQLAHKAKTIYYEAFHEENILTTGIDSFGTLVFLLSHQLLLVFFASSFHLLEL